MPLLAGMETRHSNEKDLFRRFKRSLMDLRTVWGVKALSPYLSCMLLTSIWKYVPKTQYYGILYPIGSMYGIFTNILLMFMID